MGWNCLSIPKLQRLRRRSWEWISNFIIYCTEHVINFTCGDSSLSLIVKEIQERYREWCMDWSGELFTRECYFHHSDVIMDVIASQITSLTIVYSTVYSSVDQRKCQSSASLAFVRRIHRSGEFPAQIASNAKNVSIWWRHHVMFNSRLAQSRANSCLISICIVQLLQLSSPAMSNAFCLKTSANIIIMFTKCFSTLILHRRSLDTFYY